MKPIENKFWHYVIPSMITVLLGGTFAFVDGIFIGQGTGDVGLTAVNLVAPVAALVTALAAGIGMGGAILMSAYAGNKDEKKVQKARGNTITLLSVVSLAVFITGALFSRQITALLGAKGEVSTPAFDYLKIVLTFGGFQLFSSGLSNLVINSGKSILAMIVMVGALLLNILLDGFFVLFLKMGTQGAALATVIGQAVSALIYAVVLLKDKNTRPTLSKLKLEKAMVRDIARTGFSPFGIQLAPSIVVLCINYACVWTAGTDTLAAFAVVNQLIMAVQILFTGIGNGIQPIVSYCTGAKNKKAVRKTLKKAFAFMLCIAAVLILGVYGMRFQIPQLFNASFEVSQTVQRVLAYFLLMIPFAGFNRLLVPFLFASMQNRKANGLTYADPLLITPLCLLIFCLWKGAYGIWPAMLAAQVILTVLGGMLIKFGTRKTEKGKKF